MVITIQLMDGIKYEYDYFKSIPSNIYSQVEMLKCNDNNLEDIDFIANFINLKKLNASHNKLKTLPIISSLEELDIYNNELVELPILVNLKKLYAFNNKLETINNLPNLEIIDVSHNNIISVSLGDKIKKIYISFNKITQIEILNKDVLEIECNNNKLKNINFIHGLNKLNKFNYNYNPIIYEPPYIKRFLPNNYIIINKSLHTLDVNCKKYILKLLENKPQTNYQRIDCDILNNNILQPIAKKILYTSLNSKKVFEPTLKINMIELFLNLWIYIKKYNYFDKLNKILLSNNCKCITCMFNDIYVAIK